MSDIVGRIAVAIFGIIMLFIMPVVVIAQKQDSLAQNYIDNAVVEFVDNARATGKITPRAYEQLCDKVDSAHLLCEIRITHSAAYTVPTEERPDGSWDTEVYRYDYIKEDILTKMYPDGDEENVDYQLKNGDYLKVEVRNVTPTMGIKMMRLFSAKRSDEVLFTSYGGYVGNNKQ